MKRTILATLGLLLAGNLIADDASKAENADRQMHKKKAHIVIKSDGELSDDIVEIIKEAEAQAEGDENVNVFVTKDEGGNIKVRKEVMSHGPHKTMAVHAMPFAHHRNMLMNPNQDPMSKDAAECVIKNIGKINADGAAALLRQACQDLNP